MRIDAARHHDFPSRIDHESDRIVGEGAARRDCNNFFTCDGYVESTGARRCDYAVAANDEIEHADANLC